MRKCYQGEIVPPRAFAANAFAHCIGRIARVLVSKMLGLRRAGSHLSSYSKTTLNDERMTMRILTPLSPPAARFRPARLEWLRWMGLLLAGAGFMLPLTAWLAGPDRWWSVFIFLPAYILIGLALVHRRIGGQPGHWMTRTNLGLGAIVLTVAIVFASGMDWHYAWTLMLIVPGLVIAVNGYPRAPLGSAGFGFGAWVASLGLSLAALGLAFLGQQLGAYEFAPIFGAWAWWAPFMMLPGIVALGCAWFALSARSSRVGGTILMVIGSLHLAAGMHELLDLPWYWLSPVLVAAAGAGLLLSASRRPELH